MKINVWQVAPELQDSRLYYINRSGEFFWEDEFWNSISILPRRGYYDYMRDDVREIYNNIQNSEYSDDNALPVASSALLDAKSTEEILLIILEKTTGKKYNYKIIRGCTQNDWREIIYPSEEYDDRTIQIFETLFFNTGSEWEIREDPDDIFSVYCCEWKDEDIKKEIADNIGASQDEIILNKFVGYAKIPQYKKA